MTSAAVLPGSGGWPMAHQPNAIAPAKTQAKRPVIVISPLPMEKSPKLLVLCVYSARFACGLVARSETTTFIHTITSRQFLDAYVAKFEFADFRLKADGAFCRHREGFLQYFIVALAFGNRPLHGDIQDVPSAVFEILEILVWANRRIIAHLELFAADVEPAIRP